MLCVCGMCVVCGYTRVYVSVYGVRVRSCVSPLSDGVFEEYTIIDSLTLGI